MKKIFLFLPLLLLAYSCSIEQPVTSIPLAEHPRPDFERSAWQNLNGYWQFAPDSLMAGEKENWQENSGKVYFENPGTLFMGKPDERNSPAKG